MKLKRLKNSRIKFFYDNNLLLIKIPQKYKNLIKHIEDKNDNDSVIQFFRLTVVFGSTSCFFLISTFFGVDFGNILIFIICFFLGIFSLANFIYLSQREITLKIDKQICQIVWSISKLKFQKSIKSSEINNVIEEIIRFDREFPVANISIKYSNRKEINLSKLLITTDERRWIIKVIRKFLNLKPITFQKLNKNSGWSPGGYSGGYSSSSSSSSGCGGGSSSCG